MVTPEDSKRTIESGLACEHVAVDGDRRRFRALVVSAVLAGLRKLRQHRLVYGALGERMRDGIHALSIETLTLVEWRPPRG